MVRNVHERQLNAPPATVGALIDGLASADDCLWPYERWPAMRFDRGLVEGASGGHGPIRYSVAALVPGKRAVFSFDPSIGLVGRHFFEAEPSGSGVVLRHVLEARTRGRGRIAWPLVFRPLHDALIEDSLDRAEAAVTGTSTTQRRWSLRVRALRRLLAPAARLTEPKA